MFNTLYKHYKIRSRTHWPRFRKAESARTGQYRHSLQ